MDGIGETPQGAYAETYAGCAPACSAARTVFCISMAMVMGPHRQGWGNLAGDRLHSREINIADQA